MAKKIDDLFFDKLVVELDELFPKGKCKKRGKALVLNAKANIFFRKYSKAKIDKLLKKLPKKTTNHVDPMNEEDKNKIAKEVLDIIIFHLKISKMKENKQNINLATTMFIEGVKYIKEKEENEN